MNKLLIIATTIFLVSCGEKTIENESLMIDNVDMMKTQYVHDIIPDDTYFESTSILISGDTISFICDNYCEYIVDSVLESTTEVYKVSTVKGFVLTFKQDAIETESPRGARWINFNTKK